MPAPEPWEEEEAVEEESSAAVHDAVDPSSQEGADDQHEQLRLAAETRRRAEEEERRADEAWRQLHQKQAERAEQAAAEKARDARKARAAASEKKERAAEERRRGEQAWSAEGAVSRGIAPSLDAYDEIEGGWSAHEQAVLQDALRRYPAYPGDERWNKRERWTSIAAELPGRTAAEVLRRCRQLQAWARRRAGPPLLRLGTDGLLLILELLSPPDLCMCARVSKELLAICHHDALWLPLANALPSKWAYDREDRGDEPPWAFTLRVRKSLYGAWYKLQAHLAGQYPYLEEIGTLHGCKFTPHNGVLHHKIAYGAICELVQLEMKQQGALNANVYKAVAQQLVAHSVNPRSIVPPDLHMTIREIYKTCYPGFGAGTGSGAYAPGLQAGGSSTKASTSGAMLGKGVATMRKKVADEEMRKRLDTRHEFFNLIKH
ncbi:hypothetical protein AB1Y20_005143 [Prymnesium parvum]|uniref:Myb-like domain-containing protein n=1 Tax=Prymnesium parvum TaxID=97485 RepID=A0AB34J2H9_PRYPA